ncbi:hypothetical protein DSL92_02415 [Billgrantia gudaonensis]|uniref:Uncharacterized protein n=1 Tax=Billgrantia gudaonensis TaxID=376427 RepID=A0A432JLC3_9GAMM|nr:hypothetical protein DSL92_02415 [Halomonas gudaonensis]
MRRIKEQYGDDRQKMSGDEVHRRRGQILWVAIPIWSRCRCSSLFTDAHDPWSCITHPSCSGSRICSVEDVLHPAPILMGVVNSCSSCSIQARGPSGGRGAEVVFAFFFLWFPATACVICWVGRTIFDRPAVRDHAKIESDPEVSARA